MRGIEAAGDEREAAGEDPRTRVATPYVGDLYGVNGSWLQPGFSMAFAINLGKNQQIEDLSQAVSPFFSLSLFLSNKYVFKNKQKKKERKRTLAVTQVLRTSFVA